MFITVDLLKKYSACETGIRFVERLYPNGVEILDLLKNKHVPPEILHWGAQFLPVSPEERKKYEEYVEINTSANCERSEKVFDSANVYYSHNVKNSNFIKFCRDIRNCDDITSTENADSSAFIRNSDFIQSSQKIINGKNIFDCVNVINSSGINRSTNISNCRDISSCDKLWSSTGCKYSGFSSFLTDCEKVLFCTGLKYQACQLFNKPVEESVFQNVWDDYLARTSMAPIIIEKDNSFYYEDEVNPRAEAIFEITDSFRDWIKTLPNYNNFIMYQITYDKKWLWTE